jgi:hypothetical protein
MADTVQSQAEKLKVFISYARADGQALAEDLVTGLGLAGLAPFLDRHDIAAAEDWEARPSRQTASAFSQGPTTKRRGYRRRRPASPLRPSRDTPAVLTPSLFRAIASGSNDKAARLWDVFSSAQDVADKVKASIPRCVTPEERKTIPSARGGAVAPRAQPVAPRRSRPLKPQGQPALRASTPDLG